MLAFQGEAREGGPQVGTAIELGCGIDLPCQSRLEAENAVLRHQLIVLRHRLHGRVRLTNNDRLFFIRLYRWSPSILKVLMIT
jgi:hypothetical protein